MFKVPEGQIDFQFNCNDYQLFMLLIVMDIMLCIKGYSHSSTEGFTCVWNFQKQLICNRRNPSA